MYLTIKRINERNLEAWISDWCIAKLHRDDEESWIVQTLKEQHTFANYHDAAHWIFKRGYGFYRIDQSGMGSRPESPPL